MDESEPENLADEEDERQQDTVLFTVKVLNR
jgi:hypothetical protein